VPQNVTTTSYDANNRQLTFGDKTLAYDDNGTSKRSQMPLAQRSISGMRNQLVGISGPSVNASFVMMAWGGEKRRPSTAT
jgi:hypothetical protein